MGSIELHPVMQALADGLFPPGFFEVDPRQLAGGKSKAKRSRTSKSAGGMRAGQKSLLAARDFVLPERVSHADNGDLSVSVVGSTDSVQLDQVFRLAERGEESLPSFSALPYAEQQLERRRYSDYLKRIPRKEA